MPLTYRLALNIDVRNVRKLVASATKIVVAKPAGHEPPNVAWLAWTPQAWNTLVWTESYGAFAAEIPSGDGSPIAAHTVVYPARDRAMYSFLGTGLSFVLDSPGVPRGHFTVRNAMPHKISAGLIQAAKLNGRLVRSPVNDSVLPPGYTADFIGVPKLYVWLQANVVSGSAPARIPIDAAVVVFDAAHPAQRCRYDETDARFVVVPPYRNGIDALLERVLFPQPTFV